MSVMIFELLKLLDKGQFDLVIDKLEPLKDKNPKLYHLIYSKLSIFKGDYQGAKQLLHQAEELSETTRNLAIEIAIELAYILIDNYFGDYQDTEDRTKSTYALIEELDDLDKRRTYWKVEILRHQATAYIHQGFIDKGKQHCLEAIKLAEDYGDKLQISACYNLIGLLYRTIWEFEKSKSYLEKSLEYAQQEQSPFMACFPLYNLAVLYIDRFQFDIALQYLDSIKSYSEGLDNHLMLSQIYSNYALIFFHLGKYDEAETSLRQALTYAFEMSSVVYTSRTLLIAIKMMLHNNQIEEAKRYFVKLREFGNDHENERTIQIRIDLAEAFILMSQNRIAKKADAQRILQKIIETPIAEYTLTIDAMIAQCELFLFELTCTNNHEVLEEIEELINQVIRTAEEKQLKALTIEFLALKAHLIRLNGDFEQSDVLLDTCIKNAEELGFKIMVNRFTQQKKTFLEEFQHMETLLTMNAPMYEKIRKMRVDEYIKFVNKLNIAS